MEVGCDLVDNYLTEPLLIVKEGKCLLYLFREFGDFLVIIGSGWGLEKNSGVLFLQVLKLSNSTFSNLLFNTHFLFSKWSGNFMLMY